MGFLEGGSYLREGLIRGRGLFKGGAYSRKGLNMLVNLFEFLLKIRHFSSIQDLYFSYKTAFNL